MAGFFLQFDTNSSKRQGVVIFRQSSQDESAFRLSSPQLEWLCGSSLCRLPKDRQDFFLCGVMLLILNNC
jgi:hypothetical protein